MKKLVIFLTILLSLLSQEKQKPCQSAEYKQFSFWIGKWKVTNKKGDKTFGKSHIEFILDECVILENWTSQSGKYSGKSFNYYDRISKKWHQKWIDNQAVPIEFSGNYKNDVMYYTGKALQKDGSTLLYKLTFYKKSNDLVRQHWEQSKDNGKSWQSIFDGYYRRIKS